MDIVTPRTASGFPEYLPEEQIEFNRLKSIIEEVYIKYGFSPIDTPDLELREVLLAKGGGETDQQVYELKRGKNDFCLRFDLTVPLARYVAQHQNELSFPFRRYQIGKVHRAERSQAGRFREFYQCDIDIIGTNSTTIDAELPVIINEIFSRFAFGEFVVRLNNRKILNGFLDSISLTDNRTEVVRLIDKIDKLERGKFIDALREAGLNNPQVNQLTQFTNISGDNDDILQQLSDLNISNETYVSGVKDLQVIVKSLRSLGMPEERFQIDLRIARGLDYYTGTVYETSLKEYPELGSVCSGGRYDDLASYYTNTKLPGVGISIGLTRLFYQLREVGVIKPGPKSLVNIVVLPLGDKEYDYAVKVSNRLRDLDIDNILYTEQNDLQKKMKYADAMGFKYAIIIGEDEVSNKQVSVRDMSNRQDKKIDFDELSKLD